ncbi:hypothetical protein TNCV_993941 [Trichonephila clavipes]|nr:hypothetical protein TNCV_993941 [Trichonephila clavipes]
MKPKVSPSWLWVCKRVTRETVPYYKGCREKFHPPEAGEGGERRARGGVTSLKGRKNEIRFVLRKRFMDGLRFVWKQGGEIGCQLIVRNAI